MILIPFKSILRYVNEEIDYEEIITLKQEKKKRLKKPEKAIP